MTRRPLTAIAFATLAVIATPILADDDDNDGEEMELEYTEGMEAIGDLALWDTDGDGIISEAEFNAGSDDDGDDDDDDDSDDDDDDDDEDSDDGDDDDDDSEED